MLEIPPRQSARIAYATAAVNLAAALMMLVALRPGLAVPGSFASDRISFVRRNLVLWWASWLTWHAAAVSLVLFLLLLAARFGRRAPIRAAIAALVSVVGLCADLTAEAIYMDVAPRLDEAGFRVAEAVAGILTGYLANGLYTVGGILVTWAGARQLPRSVVALAVPVWGAGLCLAAFSLIHSSLGQFWSTAVLMPLFILWAALVGRWLARRGS